MISYRNIRNIVNVGVRVHEDGGDGEADEDEGPDEGDDPGRDEPGHDHPDQDSPASADGVAGTAAQDDSPDVVETGQDDRGQLGPVTPLGDEGHAEAFDEDFEDLEAVGATAGIALTMRVNESVDPRSPRLVILRVPVPGQNVSLDKVDDARATLLLVILFLQMFGVRRHLTVASLTLISSEDTDFLSSKPGLIFPFSAAQLIRLTIFTAQ